MPDQHQLNMECRKAVRRHLAERPSFPLSVAAITLGLRHEGGFDEARVKDACAFLHSRQHVEESTNPDGGGGRYYRITAEGIVFFENGN